MYYLENAVFILEITFEHKSSAGLLTMVFSAAVDTVHIICDQRQFTYQNTLVTPNKTYTPQHPGSCFQTSVRQITFILNTEDYIELLNQEYLLQSNTTTALAWSDEFGVAYNITPGELMISSIVENPIEPSILTFDLDMTDGVIVLFFDSVMDVTTLNLTHLTLQAGRNTSDPQFNSLQGHALNVQHYGTTLCLELFADQLQVLRNNSGVCISSQSCYISFTSSLMNDASGNAVMPVTPTNPLMVCVVISYSYMYAYVHVAKLSEGIYILYFNIQVSRYRPLRSHEEG